MPVRIPGQRADAVTGRQAKAAKPLRGGIGARGVSFDAVVTPEVTRDAMWWHARRLAEERRMIERTQAEEEIIAGYTAEILQGVAVAQ